MNIYAEVFYLKKSQKDLEGAMKLAHKIYDDGSKGRICAKCGEAL